MDWTGEGGKYHLVEPTTPKVNGKYRAACGRDVPKKVALLPRLEEKVGADSGKLYSRWLFERHGLFSPQAEPWQVDWCADCNELVKARFH